MSTLSGNRPRADIRPPYWILSPKNGKTGPPAFPGCGFDLSNAPARGSLETILSPWQLAPKRNFLSLHYRAQGCRAPTDAHQPGGQPALRRPEGGAAFEYVLGIRSHNRVVPAGFTRDNLPGGICFLGRPYDDGGMIKLAYAYEQATHHRRPPASTTPL